MMQLDLCKTELSQQVSNRLSQLTTEMVRASAADVLWLMQREGLSMSRALALMFLAHEKTASISDISGYLNLSLGNTSHIVEQLVCGGYVTRTEDINDRRLRQVMLTAQGQAFVQEIKQIRIRDLAQRLECLPMALLQSADNIMASMLEQLQLEPNKMA